MVYCYYCYCYKFLSGFYLFLPLLMWCPGIRRRRRLEVILKGPLEVRSRGS